MKKGFRHWKQKVKKKLQNSQNTPVFVIVIIGLLSIGCCSPKPIAQPTVRIVETHKIDTCFVAKQDTLFCFDTDTLRVETYIHDTIVRLKVETKPIIVRDTIITKIEQNKAKKNEEKAKENPKKKIFLTFLFCFILPPLLFLIKKNK